MQIRLQLQTFYSQGDERRFFEGLLAIAGVQGCKGEGRDLTALLWRYRMPLAALRPLAARARFAWLDDPRAWWHKAMFRAA